MPLLKAFNEENFVVAADNAIIRLQNVSGKKLSTIIIFISTLLTPALSIP